MRRLVTAVLVTAAAAGVGAALTVHEVDAAPPVPESGATDWKQVSAGRNHTCAIKTSGRAYCWGSDGFGQVGDNAANSDNVTTPVEVEGGSTRWRQIDAGDNHACAVKKSGKAFCWGDDGA